MKTEAKNLTLSKRAFWDTNLLMLDFDKYADFVIIRVFERGNENDIHQITTYYGKLTIISTLTNASSLLPRAISMSKLLFHISDEDFQCLKHSPRVMNCSMFWKN